MHKLALQASVSLSILMVAKTAIESMCDNKNMYTSAHMHI